MLARVEYSVTVPVPVDTAFRTFQSFDRLLGRGIYSDISWTEGQPWQVGSRVRFVLEKPIPATVSAVVSSISPPRAIAFIHHALGITAEEHVTFGPDLRGGTRIRVIFDFLGTSDELSEGAVSDAITFLAKDALDTVVARCKSGSSELASGHD